MYMSQEITSNKAIDKAFLFGISILLKDNMKHHIKINTGYMTEYNLEASKTKALRCGLQSQTA